MPGLTDDKLRRVTATANRLRLIQIDFADENAEVRKKYLSEEIERALSDIVPKDRQAFLEELVTRFPTWDPNVDVTPLEDESPLRSPTDERELQDPSFLLTRLIDLVPTLSENEKQALMEQLKEAGLEVEVGYDWPEEAARDLGSALQLGDEESFDMARLLQLAALLVQFVRSLDQLAWETWRRLAPRSSIRRPARFRGTARRFVVGDPELSQDQVRGDLDRLRQLIASLISAVGQAGHQFAANYHRSLSPSEIEDVVKTEGVKFYESPKAKYWDKYCELAKEIGEESIDREILEAVRSAAELLMKKGGR